MEQLLQIKFPTHRVYIHHDSDNHRVMCFKYDHSACDWEIFDDYDEASDWFMQPLPMIVYRVTTSDE